MDSHWHPPPCQISFQHVEANWIGLAGARIDSTKRHVQENVKSVVKSLQAFSQSNCCFSASDLNYGKDYKRGSVLQIAVNNLATRAIKSFSDPMGRYTTQTFTGKNSKRFTLITVYRVMDGCSGLSLAFAQQRAMLVAQGRPSDPCAEIIKDLTDLIRNEQLGKSSIIVCIDANESFSEEEFGNKKANGPLWPPWPI